jgi:hypothetical protein
MSTEILKLNGDLFEWDGDTGGVGWRKAFRVYQALNDAAVWPDHLMIVGNETSLVMARLSGGLDEIGAGIRYGCEYQGREFTVFFNNSDDLSAPP